MVPAAGTPLLEAVEISKSFGGVRALDSVDLCIRAGEIHALVGENGAGKSTLTKIIGGVLQPDRGALRLGGTPALLRSPSEAMAAGIAIVHQELELATALSIEENVFLGQLPARRGWVDRRGLREQTRAALAAVGSPHAPSVRVRDLSIADRQIVELAKALVRKVKVLLMDEPTASLSAVEAARVMERARSMRSQGVGVVYISHSLDEVLAIADRITVLRDGRRVAEFLSGEADRNALVRAILGRELAHVDRVGSMPPSEPIVECAGLRIERHIEDARFRVGRGEVVGFFGLVGAGQGAIAQALFGLRPEAHAQIRLRSLGRLPGGPREAIAHGIGYVPPDRKGEGLALGRSVLDNLMLTCLDRVTRNGVVDARAARAMGEQLARDYDIRCGSLDQPAGSLSGGNQQKIVLGKWQGRGSDLLLLDQPTRGVDVGAKGEIYRLLRAHADRGGSSLVFSADAEEIDTVCDRAYVLRKGRIVVEFARDRMSGAQLVEAALGGVSSEPETV